MNLFSDPAKFGSYYGQYPRQVQRLLDLRRQFASPELIDDGNETAPSKRIGKEIPEYMSAKPTAGPLIAGQIGLETICRECRHFREWLTKLERLGSQPEN